MKLDSARFLQRPTFVVSCLDPGGAETVLVATTKVKSGDICWNSDANIKI